MGSDEKTCPIATLRCADCAWFISKKNKCAIWVIADSINSKSK